MRLAELLMVERDTGPPTDRNPRNALQQSIEAAAALPRPHERCPANISPTANRARFSALTPSNLTARDCSSWAHPVAVLYLGGLVRQIPLSAMLMLMLMLML